MKKLFHKLRNMVDFGIFLNTTGDYFYLLPSIEVRWLYNHSYKIDFCWLKRCVTFEIYGYPDSLIGKNK